MKKNNLIKFMYGIFLILLSIPFFSSCVNENDTELPFLEVSSNTLTFGVDGNPVEDGLNFFEISTNRPWRITVPEDKNWVTLSSMVGEGNAKITVSVPENINDKAEIKVEIINKIGVILSETISIVCGDITPATVIYYENFGPNGDKVNDRWQYVDQYKEWAKIGEGSESVTYDGSSASIRNSGKLSAGYEGASGNAKLFFSSDAYFIVKNITLKENQRNLNLSFGGSYSQRNDDGSYDNEFKLDKFNVKLSADGNKWSDNLTLTMKKGDEYWNLLSSDFTLPASISSLYIKFIAGEASVFSIDDVKLTTGKGGNVINLEGSGENPEEPSEAKSITIPEINAMMSAEGAVVDATADRYFEAVVQNDTLGKNFSAVNLFVATENSKDASNGVTLYGSQVNIYDLNLNKGDKVKVTLKKGLAKAKNYNGMFELTGDKDSDWVLVEKLQGTATITPVVITPDKLSDYQGMTVSIESATPAQAGVWEGGKTQKFNASGKDFNAYCNKSAVFAESQYAAKTGTITGIPSVYKNNAQILPRDAEDVKAFSSEGGEEGAKSITIPEINAMMSAEGAVVDATADRYFEAVVQNDTLGKNFSAVNLFVATENSKDASNGVTLYGSQVNIYDLNLNKGDKVKVTLKKGLAKAKNYNGMFELTGDKDSDWVLVEKLQGTATITPVVITPDKLSDYQGMTVSIESATPAQAGTWEGGKIQKFNASGKDFNAYCNTSAVFAGEQYEAKTGTITGIPSVYKSNAQILPRDAKDVQAFSGTTPPPPSSGSEIALTKDNIVSGKTGSVELRSNSYGDQDVANESTWYTFKNGDYNFTGAKICLGPDKNGGGIQVQGNASDAKKQGFIHNVSEIKEIQSIEIVFKVASGNKYDPSYNVYVGSKANPGSDDTALTVTSEKTEDGDFRVYKETYDVASKGKFNFFSIKNDEAGALYIQTITIKYKGE